MESIITLRRKHHGGGNLALKGNWVQHFCTMVAVVSGWMNKISRREREHRARHACGPGIARTVTEQCTG
jgi:hypothetical protein